ncbi:MAG: hypothetical protein ABIQ93_02385 [Saprospiraceae bacterium]
MQAIEIIVNIFYFYLFVGAVFAVFFLWKGVALLDDAAKGISWTTRALLFPGMLAMWPVLLRKWLRTSAKPVQKP